ncbi:two-component regulator propeller domain-containing protein [Seonamhaeicola sp.]|uniref:hybrid sensor histidine kinase/response regulator transcription factor n=1 Tax=Seonamhaeicola sp. TaxID=1912245 RepID=UPI00260AAE1A|nr:two-component regulator propeller domain-containing protein [Seonamhaeicola sp.]
MKIKWGIFSVCFLFCFKVLLGQNQGAFKQISIEHGLSNNRITAIVQDSLGFIWIGTKNGLNRYDGTQFKKYNQKNSGLSSNDISSLHIDKKGNVWIGTIGGGINIYDPIKEKFEVHRNSSTENNKISSNDIHTILEDKHGNIWIGTEMGIDLFEPESNEIKTYQQHKGNFNSQNFISVWAMLETLEGDLFIGTYGTGLYRFDVESKKFISWPKPDSYDGNLMFEFINALEYNNHGDLLVGTNGNGLIRLNLNTNVASKFFKSGRGIDAPIIRTIWNDNNNIWIGTDGDGIIKVSSGHSLEQSVEQYLFDNRLRASLANNTVNTIFKDNQSNIWIGTAWKGINILDKRVNNSLFYYSDGTGYDASPILSVLKDDKNLWIGTDGKGLNKYNINSRKVENFHAQTQLPLGGDYVQLIKKKATGQYWVGTFANGLILFDSQRGKIEQFKRNNLVETSLPYNDVRDLIELPTGDLWIGTWGGGLSFLNYETKTFENYRYSENIFNSLSSDNVISLLPDSEGIIWIGTHGGGLNKFDSKSKEFRRFKNIETNAKSISSDYIFDLLQDKKGNIWLATKEGLNRFDKNNESFERFEVGITTNSNTVVSLIDDDFGNIWMGTKDGIFKYNVDKESIERIQSNWSEFHLNSVCKDTQGILYFGGVEGVSSFNPMIAKHEKNDPKVYFTDLKLFEKSVSVGEGEMLEKNISVTEKITTNHKQSVITFEFSALEFPFSKVDYSVKMEGFETNWRKIGNLRSATYTNLSAGDYVFKVKASDSHINNSNNENIASIRLEVLPPYWKTWWAYVCYFILLVIILWLIKYYTFAWIEVKNNLRLEKLQREQEDKIHQLKQRFFTNISHEIRTPLTLITGTINSLMRSNVSAKEQKQLTNLKRSTGRLMNLVSELLNIRKLETGNINLHISENDIVYFIQEIFLAFSQHAISNNINYKIEKPDTSVYVWFDKIQLEKTIYNLLTNAFKFTSSGDSIVLSILREGEFVKISVKDTGKGIPENKLPHIFDRFYQNEDTITDNLGFGIGLSIAKDIVKLHSGTLTVNSALNEGSCFTIALPLGNTHFTREQLVPGSDSSEDLITRYANTSQKEFDGNEFNNYQVLIVEDNPHLLDYLNELLSVNFEVVTADNGEKGYEIAREQLPDIIVSDIMMPIMDGITLCSKLKSNILTSHIPVILLTARTMVENIMEGFETGADDYLVKPFNEDILVARIKNLLESRRQLREKFTNDILLSPREMSFTSPDQELLTKLNNIIEANIDNSEFHIEELASEMAMSHSNLYKKIKALTGMTTVAFVRDFRLKRAAQLLGQNKMSIIDVCFKVGYTDRRHFSQEFKKKFGVTPTTYAKENLIG